MTISDSNDATADAARASLARPALVTAQQALGQNRLQEAERLLRAHLAREPKDAAAIMLLASVPAKLALHDDAERLLRQALDLAPGFSEARLILSTLLIRRNRMSEGIVMLDEVLSREPGHVEAALWKASALAQTGAADEALALYEHFLTLAPNDGRIWMSYGNLLKASGRSEDAAQAFRRVLRIDPEWGEAWWGLVNVRQARIGSDDVATMRAALTRRDLAPQDRVHLHFALGKWLEDAGDHGESFHHYSAGNRLRKEMVGATWTPVEKEVDRGIRTYTRRYFEERAGQGCDAPDPIFIVGMPRAGTTLVEQILSSHSMIEGTSELPNLSVLVDTLTAERARSDRRPYPDLVADLGADRLKALGEDYLRQARTYRKSGRPFFIDKMPSNWRHVGLIHLILPKARIIDIRRGALDCCFANFKHNFPRGHEFTLSLEDMAAYYLAYVRLMRHFEAVLPGRIYPLAYETLVDRPEAEIRRLLDHLDLPFEEACLNFHQNDRLVRTPSAEQVRRPINRDGIGRWKAYEPWLQPLKSALGAAEAQE